MKILTTFLNKIKRFRYYDLLFSLLLTAIGACMIFFPSASIFIASVLCGILLCVFALYRFLLLFTTRERSLYFFVLFLIHLFTLLAALALIFFSHAAVEGIGFFIGLVLIVDALKRLYRILVVRDERTPHLFLPIVLCALTLAFGIFLTFAPGVVAGVASILLGIALIFEGVQNAVFFFLEMRRENQHSDDYIETDFQDKT